MLVLFKKKKSVFTAVLTIIGKKKNKNKTI